MALSSTHRSSLHRSLAPVVGAAEAEALLDQFPARSDDDPATAGFVREQVAISNAQFRAEIGALFPFIFQPDYEPVPVRPIPPSGRLMRKLVSRHARNRHPVQ